MADDYERLADKIELSHEEAIALMEAIGNAKSTENLPLTSSTGEVARCFTDGQICSGRFPEHLAPNPTRRRNGDESA